MTSDSHSSEILPPNFRPMKKSRIITAITILTAIIFSILHFTPFPELRDFCSHRYSTVFCDRNGKVLQVTSVGDGKRREFIPIDEIPKDVQKIFLSAEDKHFFFHPGINPLSVMRAAIQNARSGRTVSGASTVTMQLARMVRGSNSRSFSSKAIDSFNALRIEGRISKKRILELYLNNVPFGSNVEGLSSAARYFFSAEVKDLTLEQILCLSVIPRRPEGYNPIDFPENCARAASRLEGAKRSSFEKIIETAKKARFKGWPFLMPHEISRVKAGLSEKDMSGKKIVLSSDMEFQDYLENRLALAFEKARKSRIKNYAAIIIENGSGKVLAYVGSNDWFDKNGGQIDGVRVRNQMGSSMKPFLYALALENGIVRPSDVIPDIPMEFGNAKVYIPMNFDNRFNGPVLLRPSLASSLNVGAVTILAQTGVQSYNEFLMSAGFTSLEKGRGVEADLGLALGAGEVSLEELAQGFSIFPNDGELKGLRFLESDSESDGKRILSTDTARIICDILSDKAARSMGFGYSQSFETSYQSIFKTGTANQYQNIVALGATPGWTVAVWMGNFDGNTVVGKTGSSLPATVAREILDYLVRKHGSQNERFLQPEKWTKRKICSVSGMKPGINCKNCIKEFFCTDDYAKTEICTWHQQDKNGIIEVKLPAEYQQWLSDIKRNIKLNYGTMNLKIQSPQNGSIFYYNASEKSIQKIPVEIFGGMDSDERLMVDYDGKTFFVERPFSFTIPVEPGEHRLSASLGNENDSITFTVQ